MLQDTKVNSIGKYKTSLTFNGHFLKQFYTYRGKNRATVTKIKEGAAHLQFSQVFLAFRTFWLGTTFHNYS